MGLSIRRLLRVALLRVEHVHAVRRERQSASVPAKQESGSTSANIDRDDTSSRANVLRIMPRTSRTNQLSWFSIKSLSIASTASASPVALRIQSPMAFVRAQLQDGVVQFARHLQRPPVRAERSQLSSVIPCVEAASGPRTVMRRGSRRPVEILRPRSLVVSPVVDGSFQRRQHHALRIRRAVAASAIPARAASRNRRIRGLHRLIDQAPVFRSLASHAFGGRAENIGVIAAVPAACRSRASGRPCPAARRAAALPAG